MTRWPFSITFSWPCIPPFTRRLYGFFGLNFIAGLACVARSRRAWWGFTFWLRIVDGRRLINYNIIRAIVYALLLEALRIPNIVRWNIMDEWIDLRRTSDVMGSGSFECSPQLFWWMLASSDKGRKKSDAVVIPGLSFKIGLCFPFSLDCLGSRYLIYILLPSYNHIIEIENLII